MSGWDLDGWLNSHAAPCDAVVVLAGGVGDDGAVHETVRRRLEAAAAVHRHAAGGEGGPRVPIICNGGGTSHKPKYTDAAGFAVPESHIMGRVLLDLGVPVSSIFLEGYSDDTIGNAFFARVMHTEWRDWRRLLVITSDFQMPRTEAVYGWAFGLSPPPPGRPYELAFAAVPDDCLPADVLAARREREAASLPGFRGGVGSRVTSLDEAHQFVFQDHKAYAPPTAPREPIDPTLLKTY